MDLYGLLYIAMYSEWEKNKKYKVKLFLGECLCEIDISAFYINTLKIR